MLRELSSALKTNLLLKVYQQDEYKSLTKAQSCPLFKVLEWLILATKEYSFMNQTFSSVVVRAVRY